MLPLPGPLGCAARRAVDGRRDLTTLARSFPAARFVLTCPYRALTPSPQES